MDSVKDNAETGSFFVFVNSFRWVTWLLAVSLTAFGVTPKYSLAGELALAGLVFLYNLAFTIFPRHLERRLRKYPPLILIDVAFSIFLIRAYKWRSPYFLYSFSTILLGGYLWRVGGGFVVAFLMAVAYLSTEQLIGYKFGELKKLGNLDTDISHVFDYFLIAIFFSYPTFLMNKLNKINKGLSETRNKLETSKRRLETLQEVSAAMQASLDLDKILSMIVDSLVNYLSFDQAAIGLINETGAISWRFSEPEEYCHRLAAIKDSPFFERLFAAGKPLTGRATTASDPINVIIDSNATVAFPLFNQEKRRLGVLLVDNSRRAGEISVADFELLRLFAGQAAAAVDNAERYHQSQADGAFRERRRIAAEMHDNIIQNMYAIRLTLDACINKAADDKGLSAKLEQLRGLYVNTLADFRSVIDDLYKDQLSRRTLKELLKILADKTQTVSGVKLKIITDGSEPYLSPLIKKDIYSILQESVSNVIKHAQAEHAVIKISFKEDKIDIIISDDGIGFASAALNNQESGGLGLQTIKERVAANKGAIKITSAIGRGTEIAVDLPLAKTDAAARPPVRNS